MRISITMQCLAIVNAISANSIDKRAPGDPPDPCTALYNACDPLTFNSQCCTTSNGYTSCNSNHAVVRLDCSALQKCQRLRLHSVRKYASGGNHRFIYYLNSGWI